MFVMGITLTSLLYAYSRLHLGPFRPLQDAIVRNSRARPRASMAGKRSRSKNTPTILRILVKTEIDPLSDLKNLNSRLIFMRKRIGELARRNGTAADLAILEIHIYKLLKEDEIHKRSYRMDLKAGTDWIEIDQQVIPLKLFRGPGDVDPRSCECSPRCLRPLTGERGM
jgi:hypothetical protein